MYTSKLQSLLLPLLLVASHVSAHITLNPSVGAKAGEYFYTEASVPHAKPGLWTSGIEISIPRGIRSVKPQAKAGWDIITSTRVLEPSEQYVSHGQTIDTAVDKVTYKAETSDDAIHHDVLERFGMQIQLGCSFNDAKTATIWNTQRTLWFGIVQHLSAENSTELKEQTNWTGVVSGFAAWNDAEPDPSPYLFISNWSACARSNFTWFGEAIPVPLLTSADILVSEQQLLTRLEVELDDLSDKLKTSTNQQIADTLSTLPPPPVDAVTRNIAIAALVLAIVAVVLAVVLIVLQLKGASVKSA